MGTDWKYNSQTNFDIKEEPFPMCENNSTVHRGFKRHYESLEKIMTTAVLDLNKKYPNASVVVTGHSLGGAIATLALRQLETILPLNVNITLISFGSPKVGDKAFVDCFNQLRSPAFRFVRKGDIITEIPILECVHCGEEKNDESYL